MNWFHRLFNHKVIPDINTLGNEIDYEEFYGYHDEGMWLKAELLRQDDLRYAIRFTLKNKLKTEHSFRFVGTASNVDPEGLASFSELDPEGSGNPTEFYQIKTEDLVFDLFRPYDEAPAVGISICFNKPNPGNFTELRQTLWRYKPEDKREGF